MGGACYLHDTGMQKLTLNMLCPFLTSPGEGRPQHYITYQVINLCEHQATDLYVYQVTDLYEYQVTDFCEVKMVVYQGMNQASMMK